MSREKLPNRRRGITFEFEHVLEYGPNNLVAKSVPYLATTGYYDDGRLGEVFLVSAAKVSTQSDIAVKDAAIALSVGLQYGVPPEELVSSFLHDSMGRPEGALGQLLKRLQDENLLCIFPFDGLKGAAR